jgi:hypothetical protein
LRCYRVDEHAIVGIHLTQSQDGPWHIEVGDQKVDLDERFSAALDDAKNSVKGTLEEVLLSRSYESKPLSDDELEEVADMLADVVPESITLLSADVSPKGYVVRERRHHPDALVLVETAPVPDGSIAFKGTSFEEAIDAPMHRVRRRYREEFPPPGIQVLKEGKTSGGSKMFLLRMMPSSSFRIERTGKLDGAPGVLTVVWRGQKGAGGALPLEVFSPVRRPERADQPD